MDCLLSAVSDNEDNMEAVIVCLTEKAVIKAQIRAKLLFHFWVANMRSGVRCIINTVGGPPHTHCPCSFF